ncbi:MAG: sugar ABC transporter ATP-binding protein [Clostridiales bacterium]|nr:sugar ABC transporter ATP-binding protein [Clostridiales bacterium]MDD7431971.1 sugar ABC transporter ATP-binding protein [Clostridiales bacterium]MDY3060956.1 sugar ABC transporter ATP-binding protein [Eubacteriales bacterium]
MAETENQIVLSIRGMSKAFGRNVVLDHVDMDVRKGSVMGLMGENGAGKSTMMKCLFGIYQKDEGSIFLDGREVAFSGPKEALENGIAMVHQELNQCLDRSVVDNLFLGRYPLNSVGMIDEARMKNEAAELFRSLGMTVNLTQPMRRMSVSERQMCEIAKAISYHSKIIVLDEPTSSLTEPEVKKLFAMMRKLRDQGVSLIYISHKMDEVFEICDQVSVLRDGKLVATKNVADTNMNELISAMVGRSLENRFPEVDNQPGEPILKVVHLSTKYPPYLKDVSFEVRKGEIFGFYGLVGAGRTELFETIFGVRTRAAGRVYYKGRLMNFANARDAMEHGFAMITEERKANGLFLKGDITFNTTIASLEQYKTGPALSDTKMVKATVKQIKVMHTKTMGPDDMITSLSGGNQQKVIFGKWLECEPNVFMMDEPTRGIDVGAKYEIYELIIKMAKEGKTILVISSEMPEILGITNRIAVMSNGYLSGIVNTRETNQEELLRLSAKYL